MTKAEIVAQISRQSGIEKTVVMTVVESFMEKLNSVVRFRVTGLI